MPEPLPGSEGVPDPCVLHGSHEEENAVNCNWAVQSDRTPEVSA